MNSKNSRYSGFILLLLLVGFGAGFVQAQDRPQLLKKGEKDISINELSAFNAYVREYKAAICFEVPTGCAVNETRAVRARNALIFATMTQIDLNYIDWRRNSRRKRVIFQTLMEILKIAADTAAIITNGARPKTIITAASALVTLTRETVDKNLRLAEAQALYNQMDADRAAIEIEIRKKVYGTPSTPPLTLDQYLFEDALNDIGDYFRAGTWDNALASVVADTGKKKADKELELKGLKPSPVVSEEEEITADASFDARFALAEALEDDDTRKPASEKITKIVVKIQDDEKLKQISAIMALSTTEEPEEILEKLATIISDLRSEQKFDELNKLNRIIGEIGKEEN